MDLGFGDEDTLPIGTCSCSDFVRPHIRSTRSEVVSGLHGCADVRVLRKFMSTGLARPR
jgi:hypothetical protein